MIQKPPLLNMQLELHCSFLSVLYVSAKIIIATFCTCSVSLVVIICWFVQLHVLTQLTFLAGGVAISYHLLGDGA